MKTITINTEKELMQYLLNKYGSNLTLISSTDYVLGTNYNRFVPYISCDFQDIMQYMSDFTTDKNNYTVKLLNCYSCVIREIYLDDKLILIAGSEKDMMCYIHIIIAINELGISSKNNTTLMNSLINQRIDEIMSGNTPDSNIMLSERTATLD